MPPPGGYRKFNWARTYPKVLVQPFVALPATTALILVGYWQGRQTLRRIQTERFEDHDIQNAMQPFLLAERDREWLKVLKRNRDYENELMKDVPGWKTGTWYGEPVYFTLGDKWWDPIGMEVYAHSPSKIRKDEYMWQHHSEYAAPKFYDKWIPEIIRPYIW
uniref:NADH dehydrogenase [ubiquinone] 1 alpha subcomplex subunit 13 n=1 Tax=Acrobeloides nanus TaxID=290746 RepID=A0A914BWW7_9BILA